jgi:hypothetical protein
MRYPVRAKPRCTGRDRGLGVPAMEVYDELRERASDPETYIQRLITEQQP